MSKDKNKTLKTIVRGAGIIFLGSIFAYFANFVYRLIVSRYLGPADYGLISLGQMVLNISMIFAVFGLREGLIRFGAYYKGKENFSGLKGTFYSTIKITLPISIVISILLIIFSDFISNNIFKTTEFKPVLIVFAAVIPLFVVVKLIGALFLALSQPEYKEIIVNVSTNVINLILVAAVVFLGGSVFHVSLSYLIAIVLGLGLGLILYQHKVHKKIFSEIKPRYNYNKLLKFSLPLLFVGIFIKIMGWADTFFLGVFKSTTEVGIYNVAFPLAAAMGMFLTSFGQIYFPLTSELIAKRKYSHVSSSFEVIVRWIFLISFPAFLLMLVFPKDIIKICFGKEYIAGATALVILIVGYFINVIVGPANQLLKSMNKTKFIFYLNLIVVCMNIVLNIILIPKYGVNGAAIATALSLAIRQIAILLRAKSLIKIKYELSYFVKYIISGCFALFVVYYMLRNFFAPYNLIELLFGLCVFGVLYGSLLLVLRSFSKEDLHIMLAIEKRLGLNLEFIKKLMRKFI